MSNSNTKFQASLIQIDWELWIRTSTVKWEFTSRLVIGTHGVCTVTWKTIHGWNSRVPWKPTVKRQKRKHSIVIFFLCAVYLIFELLHLSPPFSAPTSLTQNQEHRASSYRQASESPPHPFQGCVGPLSACHLGFFHNISNSRRMTWATYHTPQASVVRF